MYGFQESCTGKHIGKAKKKWNAKIQLHLYDILIKLPKFDMVDIKYFQFI